MYIETESYCITNIQAAPYRQGAISKYVRTVMLNYDKSNAIFIDSVYCIHIIYICMNTLQLIILLVVPATEVTLSNLTLASRTTTTLSVTWSAGYPKCYSFTVSHSTQDGSINVTQPADSDTSHTLTSLQPGTTYRIEVEAVRKRDGADGQRAKVTGSFITDDECEKEVNVRNNIARTILVIHLFWQCFLYIQ